MSLPDSVNARRVRIVLKFHRTGSEERRHLLNFFLHGEEPEGGKNFKLKYGESCKINTAQSWHLLNLVSL